MKRSAAARRKRDLNESQTGGGDVCRWLDCDLAPSERAQLNSGSPTAGPCEDSGCTRSPRTDVIGPEIWPLVNWRRRRRRRRQLSWSRRCWSRPTALSSSAIVDQYETNQEAIGALASRAGDTRTTLDDCHANARAGAHKRTCTGPYVEAPNSLSSTRRPVASRRRPCSQQLSPTGLLTFLLACLGFFHYYLVAFALLALATHIVSDDANSVIIKSHQGQLFRGLRLSTQTTTRDDGERQSFTSPKADVVAFLGVRYASPPVKRLRFMPPTPFNYAKQTAASRTTTTGSRSSGGNQIPGQVHDMRQFGPICMQRFPMEPTREQAWPTTTTTTPTGGGHQQQQHQHRSNSGPADWRAHRAELQLGLMERLLAPGLYRSWRPIVRKLTSRFVQSEDCLNLNIYTPIEALEQHKGPQHSFDQDEMAAGSVSADQANVTQADAPPLAAPSAVNSTTNQHQQQDRDLPVLVLIHGHSFDFGAGSALDGRWFAQNNRVVVITLNYRLHMLGFPPRLASGARTNLGLLDQVAALHWIQANVRSFGGSPTKITLMGSKRGAIFVHLLMLSPLAKGLFQRAVLEDGTALSPVIANNLALNGLGSPNSRDHGPTKQQQQQQVAASQQHLRLLAQLNDCPAATGAADEEPRTNLGPAMMIECLKTKPAEIVMRHLPVELIDSSRPASAISGIPLALRWIQPMEQALDLLIKEELKSQLDDNTTTNSTTTTTVHQNPDYSRRNELEQLKRLFASARADQTAALVEAHQLDRLIGLMINRFVQVPASALHSTVGASGGDEDSSRLVGLLSELLGAIYLPSNKTLPIGPVFAPQLEPGLILAAGAAANELDLADSMLQRSSLFNRRDLLIGLTHPLVDFNQGESSSPQSPSSDSNYEEEHHDDDDDDTALPLVPGFASRKSLELGLSEEQAIGQVNLFVRSFYRYHQQEISNSIISQYLSRKSGLRPTAGAARGMEESIGAAGAGVGASSTSAAGQQHAARLQKQQFLANAMRTLYRDSLVDVPLIKSGLIHSLQQLELLADLFVGKQLSQMELLRQDENHDEEQLEQLMDESWLETEFYKFAKSYYQRPALWPIHLLRSSAAANNNTTSDFVSGQDPHLRAPSSPENQKVGPRSTFLFQFAADRLDWLQRLRATISRLESRVSSRLTGDRSVRAILVKMLDELTGASWTAAGKNNKFRCSFSSLFDDDDYNDDAHELTGTGRGSITGEGATLYGTFKRWLCRRMANEKLANFVETGNVNFGSIQRTSSSPRPKEMLERQLERAECGSADVGSLKDTKLSPTSARQQVQTSVEAGQDDHDLVQLDEQNYGNNNYENSSTFEMILDLDNGSSDTPAANKPAKSSRLCSQLIQALAFEELADEGADSQDQTDVAANGENDDSELDKWTVFNVFSQQLASLFASRKDHSTNRWWWSMDSFISSANSNSQLREAFDGKVAFWANFVNALNCSKTQPIGASSLSLFSHANSTLLNMNLNQNCQLAGGIRTASSVLQSMGGRIKQELSQRVRAWRRLRAKSQSSNQWRNQLAVVTNLSSSQNHHSPRMANMSNNHQQDQQQQQRQTSHLEGGPELSVASEPGSGSLSGSWLTVDTPNGPRSRFFNRQLPAGTVWLFGGLALAAISVLLVGSLVVLRRHWRKRQRQSTAPENQTNNDGITHTGSQLEQAPTGWNSNGLQLDVSDFLVGETLAPSPADESHQLHHNGLALAPQQQQQPQTSFIQCDPMSFNTNYNTLDRDSEKVSASAVCETDLNALCNEHRNQQPQQQQSDQVNELILGRCGRPHTSTHLVQQQEASTATNHGDPNTDQLKPSQSQPAPAPLNLADENHHLPTCNLMLMQKQHQQQLLLSSSSETTTTTNTQRARSSVSLVSGSTNSRRPATVAGGKKRVKISDPRRRPTAGVSYDESTVVGYDNNDNGNINDVDGGTDEAQGPRLVELAAHQVQLIDGDGGSGRERDASSSRQHYCPIHRSGSNLNLVQSTSGQQLVIDDATKFQLLNGHHSLMRHYSHNGNGGTTSHHRALALSETYLDESGYTMNGLQQQLNNPPHHHHHHQHQVYAARNIEPQHQHQHQRQQR
uniref:Neuroligin-4, Y-linked n=1 Tax=Aceria tosichella TaxID=561515 RepID=A0A6G1SIE4_9ACAR